MKDPKKELLERYKSVSILLLAVEKTILKPSISVVDNLIKVKDKDSKKLAIALIAGGASYGASSIGSSIGTSALLTAGTSFGATAGGLATGTTITALGGPIVWTIVGGGVLYSIIKKIRSKKKEEDEKIALLKRIIAQQQAIIEKLWNQNQLNKREIQNLKEALQMIKEAETQVKHNFAYA